VSDCSTIIKLIHAYLDGELDVKESIRVQAHLEECERCRRLYQDEKAFLDLLPSGLTTRSAPRLARQHISDALSREATRRQRQRRRRMIAVSPAVLAAVAVLIAFFAAPRSHVPGLVQVAVSEHERYLKDPTSLGLTNSDHRTVVDWLRPRLQMPLHLPIDRIPEGQLAGATVLTRGGQAAYLVYRFGNEPVSLLVTTPRELRMFGEQVHTFKNTFFQPATVEGHHTLLWSDRRHTYVLVAERAETLSQACVICHSSQQGRGLVAGFSTET